MSYMCIVIYYIHSCIYVYLHNTCVCIGALRVCISTLYYRYIRTHTLNVYVLYIHTHTALHHAVRFAFACAFALHLVVSMLCKRAYFLYCLFALRGPVLVPCERFNQMCGTYALGMVHVVIALM